jgi:hypothetical protein
MELDIRSDVAMASTAVHETVHAIQEFGGMRITHTDGLVQLPAYAVQFAFYSALSAAKKNDPDHSLWAARYRANPVEAARAICMRGGFYNCP